MADDPDSFFMSLRPLLVLGQISAVLPLIGTTCSKHQGLKFSWKNWQIAYSGVVFVSTVFFNVCSTIDNLSDGIRLDKFGSTVFYTVCILNSVFFMKIARGLPWLFQLVFRLEKSLITYGFPDQIGRRVQLFIYVFTFLAIFEHGLLTWLTVKGVLERTDLNSTFLETFYAYRFPVILDYTGHNDFLVIFIFTVNVICTLNWNYLDYFIICISMEISGKFSQIVKSLDRKLRKNPTFWEKVAQDYNNLAVTTKMISSQLSKLVFMSYCSNLYHISLQLLRSLKFQGDTYAKIYFYFSMIYLISRMVAVSLQAAKIQEDSHGPINSLFTLKNPSNAARRFLHQVLTDDISITGLRCFTVNRTFIITLTGTLITYEVILLQLNSLKYQDSRL